MRHLLDEGEVLTEDLSLEVGLVEVNDVAGESDAREEGEEGKEGSDTHV